MKTQFPKSTPMLYVREVGFQTVCVLVRTSDSVQYEIISIHPDTRIDFLRNIVYK